MKTIVSISILASLMVGCTGPNFSVFVKDQVTQQDFDKVRRVPARSYEGIQVATVPEESIKRAKEIKPLPSRSLVYLFRSGRAMGSAVGIEAEFPDRTTGVLGPKTYFVKEIDPDSTLIHLRTIWGYRQIMFFHLESTDTNTNIIYANHEAHKRLLNIPPNPQDDPMTEVFIESYLNPMGAIESNKISIQASSGKVYFFTIDLGFSLNIEEIDMATAKELLEKYRLSDARFQRIGANRYIPMGTFESLGKRPPSPIPVGCGRSFTCDFELDFDVDENGIFHRR
ncbi:hypothetical protein EPO44_09215 [bacterium]|nr:MAG: hypothetical protein EPO44_09215 [bacterium]